MSRGIGDTEKLTAPLPRRQASAVGACTGTWRSLLILGAHWNGGAVAVRLQCLCIGASWQVLCLPRAAGKSAVPFHLVFTQHDLCQDSAA